MSEPPFFEPWTPPDDDVEEEWEVDVPWVPPVHVSGVVVPVGLDVYRGADAVVRVTHVVAYRRGIEVHVGAWMRPGARRLSGGGRRGLVEDEPRVGLRLADGTRLGHRHPHSAPPPHLDDRGLVLVQLGGHGGGLTSTASWWLHPLPEGDAMDVVVMWESLGVPESSARVDLRPLREAGEREQVLWDPPSRPPEGIVGWSPHARPTTEPESG